ncbi:hypothetical protein KIN20_027859 [Parelaphostrongylus tenuis]|uniref:Thioredoxin domain-containing protein n=1 Tax=Parelaphostrongylus tenuis TaxID=148309 RepID=A0AAD5WEA8_PARTN|nr:hypothetical protein KIN20_027859 [Parelaphostrongylus tenuis]
MVQNRSLEELDSAQLAEGTVADSSSTVDLSEHQANPITDREALQEETGKDPDELEKHPVKSLDVKTAIDLLLSILSPRNMGKCLIFLLGFMLANYLWCFLVEVYSRPTILKPRGPLPFFSNSSSSHVTDYYTGNFLPERMLRHYDLLVVMYYAPWSFHSRSLKHPFEVVALILRNHKNVRFVAVNCWTTTGECRKMYKIYQYPLIVAYSSTVHSIYQGEHSTDHLYRWIVNIRNPFRYIGSAKVLKKLMRECHLLVVGYFPFKNVSVPTGYRAFAASAMMLHSGLLEDEYTCLSVVTSERLAREVGIRFEGDIVIYSLESDSEIRWSVDVSRTAENIVEWVKRKRNEAIVKWIHFNRNTELMTEQLAELLKESAILLLVTPLTVVYRGQSDILLFTELAREYWNCDNNDLLSVAPIESKRIVPKVFSQEASKDKLACAESLDDIAKMDSCCRSLLPSVDWNMACASSAKYHWEDEEMNTTTKQRHKEPRRRRSHWTEQVLAATKQCIAVRNGSSSANSVLSRCCEYYERLFQHELTSTHKANLAKFNHDREIKLADLCTRGRLFEYMKYPVINESLHLFNDSHSIEGSIRGLRCTKRVENDTLTFVVLDSLHYHYFLNKWGLQNVQLPAIIAVDASRELFSVMDGQLSQNRIREFITDYHSNVISDDLMSEEDGKSRFVKENDILLEKPAALREKRIQVLERLTQRTFHSLIESQHNTSHDVVVLFSGGRWHSPSTIAMHVYHNTASYFSSSEDLIKFYVIDVTRNELPYNFNFDRIPAIVIFLANRTDISWKYPDGLPISQPNLLSFLLSHCSTRLRWKMALTNCGRICVIHNQRHLRKRQERLLLTIRGIRESLYRKEREKGLHYFVKQLRIVRRLQQTLRFALHQSEMLAEDEVNRLLHNSLFEEYLRV